MKIPLSPKHTAVFRPTTKPLGVLEFLWQKCLFDPHIYENTWAAFPPLGVFIAAWLAMGGPSLRDRTKSFVSSGLPGGSLSPALSSVPSALSSSRRETQHCRCSAPTSLISLERCPEVLAPVSRTAARRERSPSMSVVLLGRRTADMGEAYPNLCLLRWLPSSTWPWVFG